MWNGLEWLKLVALMLVCCYAALVHRVRHMEARSNELAAELATLRAVANGSNTAAATQARQFPMHLALEDSPFNETALAAPAMAWNETEEARKKKKKKKKQKKKRVQSAATRAARGTEKRRAASGNTINILSGPVLYVALLGSTPGQRDLLRETWLANVTALQSGAAVYSFFIGGGAEGGKAPRRDTARRESKTGDTVVLALDIAGLRRRVGNASLARAWGLGTAADASPTSPTAVPVGQWQFLLIGAMRHALHTHPGFRYWLRPAVDGIVCLDSLVATLRLLPPHPGGFFCGDARKCV